jgi:hypothetical protein
VTISRSWKAHSRRRVAPFDSGCVESFARNRFDAFHVRQNLLRGIPLTAILVVLLTPGLSTLPPRLSLESNSRIATVRC